MKTSQLFCAFLALCALFHCRISNAQDADQLAAILIPGEDWKVVADHIGFADGASSDPQGNFYFSDLKKPAGIFRITPDGTKTTVADAGMTGTKFGPDGRLYTCGGGKVAVFDLSDGKQTIIADKLKPNDIAVNSRGQIYITETDKKQVTLVDSKTGQTKAADIGISRPNGIGFSPDQNTLYVSDSGSVYIWSFKVEADGSLTQKKQFATMKAPDDKPGIAHGDGMIIDPGGRSYVVTTIGLQIFDADGQRMGILPKPQPGAMTNVALAGEDHAYLYLTCGDKVFKRKIQPALKK